VLYHHALLGSVFERGRVKTPEKIYNELKVI
jgi:hypothetical protein